MRRFAILFALVVVAVLGGAVASAERPSDQAETPPPPAAPVIRISVELIQLDVVVTDKKGRHVADLGPGDFEVLEDGRPQKVAHAFYAGGRTASKSAASGSAEPAATPPVDAASTRTTVLVYDDLGLSPEGATWARRALHRVVERLEPTERVALVSTSSGGDLRFPADRRDLLEAVGRIRYRPWSRQDPGLTAPGPAFFALNATGGAHDLDQLEWNQRLAVYSLAAVKSVIGRLADLPGRKAVILVSEGFVGLSGFYNRNAHGLDWRVDRVYGDEADVPGALRRLGDFSARAGVVVHAIDPRGLVTAGLGAGDSSSLAPGRGATGEQAAARRLVLYHTQESLRYLPDLTGGLALTDTNDLSGAVEKVLADMSGYYLVGYEPEKATFAAGPRFHEIDVRVKRPGLKVRTRKGFYGVTDEEVAAAAAAP